MKRILIAAALAAPVALLSGCSSCPWCGQDDSAALVLCDDCGVEKGTEGCCDDEAERCDHCDKIKGSEGCCK